jgi:hypothetical protein
MKFLKQKNISKFNISDQTLFANQYGRAVMNLTGGLRLPKGTTAQRPQGTSPGDDPVRTLSGADGFIRYNTDSNEIEAYIDGDWVTVRAAATSAITKQTLGPGNYEEELFGPLEIDPKDEDNIIVLVENVFQISDTNFIIVENPPGLAKATYGSVIEGQPYPSGIYLKFSEAVPLDKNVTIYFGYAN